MTLSATVEWNSVHSMRLSANLILRNDRGMIVSSQGNYQRKLNRLSR
jgi:hypothetical protein